MTRAWEFRRVVRGSIVRERKGVQSIEYFPTLPAAASGRGIVSPWEIARLTFMTGLPSAY